MRARPAPAATLGATLRAGLLALASAAGAAEASATPALESHGEWRATLQSQAASPLGPLAQANRLAPGTAAVGGDAALGELEWRLRWHALVAELWLAEQALPAGRSQLQGRLNELAASGELGDSDWQWTAGRKRVGWDVGYGFRPNDVVAQEPRRTLLPVASTGRPLLMAERFWGAERALSLVWANPQHAGPGRDALGADESALALRAYQRLGAADAYAFARWGRHSGSGAGLALAWVAGDELELHASWRVAQRHDAWQLAAAAGGTPLPANPWQVQTRGSAQQSLIGLSWTGSAQQSLLLEAWHDGQAPSNADWRAWRARGDALTGLAARPGLPPTLLPAIAGNLAWQTSPFGGAGPRRDNLFLRLAWQPNPWLLSLDTLLTPADGGRLVTLGLQWQGDRWRFNAAWRQAGGPSDALLVQLPARRTAVLAAAYSF